MYNGNASYDFNIFEEHSNQAQIFKLPNLELRRKKRKIEKLKFYVKCASLILASGMTFGAFLFGQAKLVEYNSQILVNTKELEEMKSRNEQLEIKLVEGSTPDSKSIEKDSMRVEAVTISSGDKAQIF